MSLDGKVPPVLKELCLSDELLEVWSDLEVFLAVTLDLGLQLVVGLLDLSCVHLLALYYPKYYTYLLIRST